MDAVNPRFVLRNYLMEEAIKAAEKDNNFDKFDKLCELAYKPFENKEDANYTKIPPKWALDICVSCSS